MRAAPRRPLHVAARGHSTFRDGDARLGDHRNEPFDDLKINVERFEITTVDSNDLRLGRERALELSLRSDLDPDFHLQLGRALAPLREQGVLIVGSGLSFHNLRAFGPAGAGDARRFDDWLTETLEAEPGLRAQRLRQWENAPSARRAHPREEHLLPLMVAAGAAGSDPGKQVFSDEIMGLAISAYRFG